MTLLRMVVILAGGLALLLAVVILRADAARLQYQISKCERQAELLCQQLVEAEIELARLRNPMWLRQRMEEVVSQLADQRPAGGTAPQERR